MKLKDSEKGILVVLLGIAVLALSIMYIAKPNYEEIQTINSECEQLQIRLADLQAKQARRDEFLAGCEEYKNAFDDIMANFPADLNQEVSIMFFQGIKEDNDFQIASLGLGQKEQFYTLGLNGGDVALTDGTEAASTEETSTEAASTEAASTETGTTDLTAGGTASGASYVCYRADFPVAYTGSYESLKDVIEYIGTFSSRMTINSINIAYAGEEEDRYSGTLDVMCYAIESEERPQSNIELNEVEIGVDNIFTGDGAGNSDDASESLNRYDENDGASIENSYDFYAMINPASSDVSAKVVGQNGTGKESTVIFSSDNTISTLSYEFYEKDGKNYCKYTLDNSTFKEVEVTSAEDIKLLIQSSARKGEDDKVGIRVSIKNSTSLPVYVKVAGDDASSPRVNIASKSGAVKVY
ncbi:MAG: hypothetical protein ACI4A3_08555 [Lachnospiraceae bacterium]